MIPKTILKKYYENGHSMKDIATVLKTSVHQVSYWMDRYGIERRNISEAIYKKHNPHGDPFRLKYPLSQYDRFMRGLGLGLFWGEGMKNQKTGVRLGNTDPHVILYFREFLCRICGVSREKLKYSLQLFGDVDKQEAIQFWCKLLSLEPHQLGKISIVRLRGKGTYKRKNRYGVLQIACHNTKLKRIVDGMIRTLKKRIQADVAQLVEHVHGRVNPAHFGGNA